MQTIKQMMGAKSTKTHFFLGLIPGLKVAVIKPASLLKEDAVCILLPGSKFLYVLPGFDVLGVELHHIKVKGFNKIGNDEDIFDLFVKNDSSLSRSYLTILIIKDLTVVKVFKILFCIM